MVWNKKGGFKLIVSLIAILIAGGIVIYLVAGPFHVWMLSKFSGEFAERLVCRRSVELNAQRLSIRGIQVLDPFVDVKCKTIPLVIKEKDPERIKEKLADGLYKTWVDFHEGEKELFEHVGGTFCMLRYAPIIFENKVEVKNFIKYLTEEKPFRQDVSYWKYITGEDISDVSELEEIPDKIDTNKDYAIVFMITKTGYWQKKVLSTFGFAGGNFIGAIGGYVLGTYFEDFSSTIALVPFDEMVNLGCRY